MSRRSWVGWSSRSSVYSASKFALEALAEAYRYGLSSFGVDFVSSSQARSRETFFPSSPEPSDQDVLKTYGGVAAIPDQIKQHSNDGNDPQNPPQPQRVANAIAQLVEATEREASADGRDARRHGFSVSSG